MRATVTENKVVVSSTVEREDREALEKLARRGHRTLSQEVRIAVREYLARRSVDSAVEEREA